MTRPLAGGQSISKELLTSAVVSKSASPQKAITRFPPRSPKPRNGPIKAAGPNSSANLRRAACSGSSDASISPFGIDQAPSSFVAPVRAAGMDKQHFQTVPHPAIGQYARAQIGFRGSSLGGRHYILDVWLERYSGSLHCSPCAANQRPVAPTSRIRRHFASPEARYCPVRRGSTCAPSSRRTFL
jgi:hypothetical protein